MRKKPPEHVNQERWLVSYADLITLLFAFFVIMYSISQADVAKFKKVSESFREVFDSKGTPLIPTGIGGAPAPLEGPGAHPVAPDLELQTLGQRMEESVKLELGIPDVSEVLQLEQDSRGLIVRISAKSFFEPNEAVVNPDLRPVLDRIAKVLAGTARAVRVEGHADPSEAKPSDFLSAWELSAARAAWVVQYWIRKFELDPKRLSVAGFSYLHPRNPDNATDWAKARNRRVEIVVEREE